MPRPFTNSPFANQGFSRRPGNRPIPGATGSPNTYPVGMTGTPPPPDQSTPPTFDHTPPDYMPLVEGGEGPQPPDTSLNPIPNWPLGNAGNNPPVAPTAPQQLAMRPGQLPHMVPNTNQPAPLSIATPPNFAPPQTAPPGPSTPPVGATMNNGQGLIYTWNGTDWKPDQAAFTQYQQNQGNLTGFGGPRPPDTPAPASPYGGFGGIVQAAGNALTPLVNSALQLGSAAPTGQQVVQQQPPQRPFQRFVPPPSPPPYPRPHPSLLNNGAPVAQR